MVALFRGHNSRGCGQMARLKSDRKALEQVARVALAILIDRANEDSASIFPLVGDTSDTENHEK
jgi:hypothetical protein